MLQDPGLLLPWGWGAPEMAEFYFFKFYFIFSSLLYVCIYLFILKFLY